MLTRLFSHVFGVNAEPIDTLYFIDDQTVLFQAGNHAIVYNVDSKQQRVFSLSRPTARNTLEAVTKPYNGAHVQLHPEALVDTTMISATCMSPTRHWFAVAEGVIDSRRKRATAADVVSPSVTIYEILIGNLKRRRTLHLRDVKSPVRP
jgi:hypothetical protein